MMQAVVVAWVRTTVSGLGRVTEILSAGPPPKMGRIRVA